MKEIPDTKIFKFQRVILNWYKENGRHFKWRNPSASNYQKIIVEVLLQRTKAETIANFFSDFLKLYPSWKKLSTASEKDIQSVLRPIGLYNQKGSRLYKMAQEMRCKNGRFPKSREEVEKIPMMGQYIANAYELFILNKPAPLLDVNMARVLERYFGPRKLVDIRYDPYLKKLSMDVVNHKFPKKINWAILDLGAMVCKKKNPNCQICPLKENCLYFNDNILE
ncbi:hypothetical protein C7S20_16735 [Christiangramia fulva]|uniref:HhH-GPD domain-containing protein n=1 Tax=Christiangramia fulva TaxID=2126553 RepID=A0A2R3Z929_9FLAO|nr:hypothetical protein [Christiangramia fulva]AVR46775.1 hypothetical protein C7S20_16735 [Christiangramia fulva]